MSDRLREALEWWKNLTAVWPPEENGNLETIVAAARRFLALTETGRRVDYCETHGTLVVSEVRVCPLAHHETPQRPCRIVSKFLADYLTEEDRP